MKLSVELSAQLLVPCQSQWCVYRMPYSASIVMSHWESLLADGQNLQGLVEHDQHQAMPAQSRRGI